MGFNGFGRYYLHGMGIPNTETGKANKNIIGKKYQDKDKLTLSNALENSK